MDLVQLDAVVLRPLQELLELLELLELQELLLQLLLVAPALLVEQGEPLD